MRTSRWLAEFRTAQMFGGELPPSQTGPQLRALGIAAEGIPVRPISAQLFRLEPWVRPGIPVRPISAQLFELEPWVRPGLRRAKVAPGLGHLLVACQWLLLWSRAPDASAHRRSPPTQSRPHPQRISSL